ncbi:glycosyltransferase family 4 protein [Sphingomonas sabuli]|uniref:Glycosyltransferase family 4 protein n=1 Tax=Sphingomonas sabuli TaxID=2764186 RepID=A0A7G9L035_9SPHN|nr:glycosyltransferase family 4 protein [Sphingomonas sabuli]QNM81984.1 glycosyltransferase family 4 protein [Sphingomonas sabuli]
MRIAQIAPLAEAVPPKLYGGTERVIWWLTEALVDLGHDVTLYASADSDTSARLVPCADQALRLAGINDHLASTIAMLRRVMEDADKFDAIHFHIDFVHFPIFMNKPDNVFTTLHGRLDIPAFWPAFEAYPEMKLVSISDNQRLPMPNASFVKTIYHGLPEHLIPFNGQSGEYLAFLGRISPEKRPDRAIEIAKRTGTKLKMAAKVDHADRAYFESEIEPLLDDPLIEFIGEIDDRRKPEFLGNAKALLFPIDWPEPFGLVMIEAMAAGTPVVAWRNGSTPEVIEDGRNGFLVESIDEAVAAVERLGDLPRSGVRGAFEDRFTARRMAQDYVNLFETARGRSAGRRSEPLLLAH